MKKFLKILAVIIIVFILILAIIPLLFQDQIEQKLKNSINDNINAKVEWKDLNLSLISGFPNAEVGLENITVINKKPFEGDTLFSAKAFELQMGLLQLFSPESLIIDDINVENANVFVIINEDGIANYNIQKPSSGDTSKNENKEEGSFSLELKSYQLSNSNITYKDADVILLELKNLNHFGKGDFSKNIFTLRTHTDTQMSIEYDDTNYLNNHNITLNADIAMDLDQMRFTFEDNEGYVNKLPLNFEGFFQIFDDRQEIDIKFTTPDSDFKNLFGVVPEAYAGNLDGIDTKGDFNLNGRLFGKIDDTYIPKMNIELVSKNAQFKYDDLPNKMEDINLDITILNSTGLVEDTSVDISTLSFRIGKDQFSSSLHLKDLTDNIKTDIEAKGKINLTNLSQTYPMETDLDLNGILDVDLSTSFDMNSIDKKQYQNINSKGHLALTDFKYTSEDVANPFEIKTAKVNFNKATAKLSDFEMRTGDTDITANGQLNNLIGYLFSDTELSGNFQAMSNKFVVNDFMTSADEPEEPKEKTEQQKSPADEEAIKIPAKLDLSLNFTANEVVYDNFNLKNAVGKLSIKDQKIDLSQIQADLFGGKVLLDGNVSTKESTPDFGISLKLDSVDIVSTIENVDMLRGFTPILKSLIGKISTDLDVSGNMTKTLTPVLMSLTGQGLAEIIQAKVEPERMPLANALNNELKVIDFSNLSISDVMTSFSFNDGAVNVKPVQFNVEDIDVIIQGKHTLNNIMDYKVQLALPGKYLGDEVGNKLAKLGNTDLENTKVDLPIVISGDLKQPKINIDMKSAVNNLTNQIIEQQKGNLIDEAGDKLSELISGGKDDKKTDSTSTKNDNVKETVENVLGGLLGGKKKKEKKKDDN